MDSNSPQAKDLEAVASDDDRGLLGQSDAEQVRILFDQGNDRKATEYRTRSA